MPEETQAAQTPDSGQDVSAPDAAAPQVDTPSSPPSTDADAAQSGVASAEGDEAAFLARLDAVDAKKLRSHPKIAGLVGDLLNRERPRIRQQLRDELLPALRDELELERLQRFTQDAGLEDRIQGAKEVDPAIADLAEAKYREVKQRVADRQAERDAETQRASAATQAEQTDAAFMQKVASFQSRLPEAVQREVANREFDTFDDYLEAVSVARVKVELEDQRPKIRAALESELREAVELDEKGERRKASPRLDLDNGRATNGKVTINQWSQWDRPTRLQWQRANPAEYDALMRAESGRATV